MTEEEIKYIASQLRKPIGAHGIELGERLNVSNATIYEHTLDVLNATAGDHILEIGMGNGAHIGDILSDSENIQYTACDYSKTMADEAVRINQKFIERQQLHVMCADVCDLPLKDESVTKAYTINTMYFWDDVDAGMDELRRVLRPGGQLIIAGRPKHIMETYPFTKHGFRMFENDELTSFFLEHVFNNIFFINKKEAPREINGELHEIETLIISGIKK